MTASLTPMLKGLTLALGLALLPSLSVNAASVEILRWRTQGDLVKLRVRVLNEKNIPVQGLKSDAFQIQSVDAKGQRFIVQPSQITVKSPQQAKPDPAYLVLLIDMSGSMRQNDLSGAKKLQSAIDGIKGFIQEVRKEKLPVKIAVVPYGESGEAKCAHIYPVSDTTISQKLLPVDDPQIDAQLDAISQVSNEVCATTNIYQPLGITVKFLAELNSDTKQESSDHLKIPPKLAVILLSDGFDAFRDFSRPEVEQQRFQTLLNILTDHPEVVVHTMGYGERLGALRDRINSIQQGACPLSDRELTVDNVMLRCRFPKLSEFVVDEQRLTEIAETVNKGIHKFPGNPTEVVNTLRTFLVTLREYEIQYRQPKAEPAGLYLTKISVKSPSHRINHASEQKKIRLDNYAYQTLSLWPWRSIIFFLLLVISGIGFYVFTEWSKKLKRDAEQGQWESD